MRSEAIILFLKQLDFFFRILERKEAVDVQVICGRVTSSKLGRLSNTALR
jgi:hypothetical protein